MAVAELEAPAGGGSDGHEAFGHLALDAGVDLVAGTACPHVLPGAVSELPHRGGAAADDVRDLDVGVAEHLVQDEHRAFGRAEGFQHDQQRHRGRLGGQHRVGRVGDQRFGQPLADVGLPATTDGLPADEGLVDRDPHEVGAWVLDPLLVGADLRSSGVLATAPGGHPSQLMTALDGSATLGDAVGAFDTVANVGQATAFVEARLAEGVDYLKVVVDDGAVHGAELPVLAPEVLAALVEAAHAAELPVIAHAITASEVRTALDAGVDGLAHVWADAGPGAPALASRIAAQGVFVVSTLVYFEVISRRETGGVDHAACTANWSC